jgi:hypothetical protein
VAVVVAAAPSVVLMPFRLTTVGGKAPLEAKQHMSIDLPGSIHCRHVIPHDEWPITATISTSNMITAFK